VKALHVASLRLVAIKTLPIFDNEKRQQMIRELKLLYRWQMASIDHDDSYVSPTPNKQLSVITAGGSSNGSCDSDDDANKDSFGSRGSTSAAAAAVIPSSTTTTATSATVVSKMFQALTPTPTAASAPAPRSSFKEDAIEEEKSLSPLPTSESSQPQPTLAAPSPAPVTASSATTAPVTTAPATTPSSAPAVATTSSCPEIVSFYDAFVSPESGSVNLVVEYMNGGSLQDLVDLGGCPDPVFLASVATHCLRGLKFLHDTSTPPKIHRDIKPANILINTRGECKIADFGIYREMDPTGSANAATFIGTLSYMSPERIVGGDYGCPSDVWSIGLTLVTVALGRCPVTDNGRGYWALMHELTDKPPPTLPLGDPHFGDEVRHFIGCMLTADPLKRWTASQLLEHPFLRGHQQTPPQAVAVAMGGVGGGGGEMKTIIVGHTPPSTPPSSHPIPAPSSRQTSPGGSEMRHNSFTPAGGAGGMENDMQRAELKQVVDALAGRTSEILLHNTRVRAAMAAGSSGSGGCGGGILEPLPDITDAKLVRLAAKIDLNAGLVRSAFLEAFNGKELPHLAALANSGN